MANLNAIDALIDKDEKTSKQSIMEAITAHCGDLPGATHDARRRDPDALVGEGVA